MIDATNRNTALASALVEELVRSGVRHAILSPGSRSSPVALALDREPGIELSVVLDERSAGFVALGCALATGAPALVACTSGSAAANLHPAVVEADQAGVPLIVLTSDRPPELRGIGAGQTIDQIGLYGSAVRWFCEAGTHDADDTGLLHLRSLGCRAWAEATSGRGPVHLNLSWRDPLGPEPRPEDVTAKRSLALEGRSKHEPLTGFTEWRHPDIKDASPLAERLADAERGLIVAGRNLLPTLGVAIGALSQATGFPVLAEPTSNARLPSLGGPPTVAAYDLIARSQPAGLSPDLILRCGDMPTSKPLRAWIEALDVAQIVVDPPGRWNEPTRTANTVVRADAAGLAFLLADLVTDPFTSREWQEAWRRAEDAAQRAIDETLASAPDPTEPGIARALRPLVGHQENLLLASSMPIRDFEAFSRAEGEPAWIRANRGANGIDGLVSTACGIARGSHRPTWLLIGDLALAHDIGGLASAQDLPAPLRIVVVDNGGGGIFDFLPQAEQVESAAFERLFTTPSGLDMERVAATYGIDFAEIGSEAELAGLADSGTILARVRVERAGNVDLHRRIADAVSAAIAAQS
ncbi:MAG: 2-succinyl-5-enolpyruvyl-6-hydroxy-3-cyclohexene-1-carboxylic-acid synthase [Solirubrobacterales bacterium]